MKHFIEKHERAIQRFLEILPGFISWNLILFPYWGIFFIPSAVAYFILAYNIYWFYQSLQIAITGIISHIRIQASMHNDWVGDLKKDFKNWREVQHVVIIATYREPLETIARTIQSLVDQTLPCGQIHVVLATEKRAPQKEREEKVKKIKKEFGKKLVNFYVTIHELVPGEIIGKSSNEKYAAIWFKENVIDKKGKNIDNYIVTSCDADHVYHPKHFASLTYGFLSNDDRYNRFWQPALMFYNNIWQVPAIIRVTDTLGSIFFLSQLPRKDRLINTANYSLSFRLLDKVGYWDADKIPEDWGIFFKAYFKMKGGTEVEPLYLPLMADAPEANGFFNTINNMYQQRKRWAWGVSDDPWVIKKYFLTPGVPFLEKTMRVLFLIQSHFLWPVHWFAITIGLQIPTLLNPSFGRTTLGYMVPKVSSFILTVALSFLIIMLLLDRAYKPKKPQGFPFWKTVLVPFELLLMPLAGFIFAALPGIDAHTRLMLGRYIEYRVTEKV